MADDGEPTPVDEAGEIFSCPECEELFETQGKLNSHLWVKHRIKKDRATAAKPGRKPARKPPARTRTPRVTSSGPSLASRLEQSFGIVGIGVGMLDRYDGQVIVNGTPALCKALSDWADADPKARKYIEMLCLDMPWMATVMVTLSIAWPIAEHHRLVKSTPAPLSSFKPTETGPRETTDPQPNVADMMQQAAKFASENPDMMAAMAQTFGGGHAAPMTGKPAETPAAS